ncbi:uncharacterized protein [Leptinotarsa decemlineata]|uniref:uncharacterized protein n=1 Tax=Leptinotarsa decemlineata TaxID=7539 RepID=UPI003D30AE5C
MSVNPRKIVIISFTRRKKLGDITPLFPNDRSLNSLCPDSSNHIIYVPDSNDCSRYYKCIRGQETLLECPAGLHWSRKIQNCDFPQYADCSTSPGSLCPYNSTHINYYPDTTNCSRYYKCKNGQQQLLDCPVGLHWSKIVGNCDFPEYANCVLPDHECPASGSKQIVYPADCSKYYQCENGNKELKDCPESLFFNINTGLCDFIDRTNCQRPTAKPTAPTSATTITTPKTTTTTVNPHPDQDCPASGSKQIAYPGDCSKYYQCVNGNKELKDCPESLFFNVNTGLCDFVDQTNCQVPTAKPTVPTSTKTVTTPKTTTTTVNPHPDQDCPVTGSKQIVYPADCSKYYQCENGNKELKDCPESLFFNINTGLCDFIDQTNCKGHTVKPTVPTSATTVTTSKTTTTTLNPNPDQDCPASGSKQIVYPGDCSKYYQCENGNKELKDCPESLFFNVNNGLCDFIDQTNCQGPTAKPTVPTPATTVSTPKTSETTVNPHPDQDCPASGSKQIMYPADCSKYYQCENGIKELKDCPESLFFNFDTGLCDFIDQTNCQGSTVKPNVSTPATTVTTAKTTTTTVNPNPDQDCPAIGSKQIMYPADCSKYYQCENGKKELKNCPESLFFNFNTGLCDFIDQTNCQRSTAKPTVPTPATSLTTPKTTTTTVNPHPDQDCPASGSKQIMYPADCSKYYQCENGIKELKDCPESLFFNIDNGLCDFMDQTNCQGPTAKPTVPIPATTVTTPKTTTTTVNPHPDQDCPASGSKQIMYPADCSKYYQCENGIKELKDCPESLFFNINNGLCDFIDQTNCQGPTPKPTVPTPATTVTTPKTTTTTVNPHPDQDCPASGSKQIIYPADCSKYYQCENGNKELKDCPESLFFNFNTGLCDFIDQTDCQGPTAKPTVPTPATTVTTPKTTTTTVNPRPDQDCPASGSKQIMYPADCSKYYQCENGKKELKDCPESLFFNFNTGLCDFIDQTNCQSPTAKPTVSSPATTVTTPKTTTTTTSSSPVSTTTHPPPTTIGNICNGLPDGSLLPDARDCSKFYECAGGIPVSMVCPAATVWDENIKTCNFANEVDCHATQ